MNYVELYIPARDALESEIAMAELAAWPFESFEQGDTFLKAWIRADDLAACRSEVAEYVRGMGVEGRFTEIEQQNWNALWESNLEPVEVSSPAGRVVIRAPFHDEPADALDIVIMPKMSFGTGHHATTWLMVAAMLELDLKGLRGLDMGSGTGVLAIVAAKRGAAHTDAVDIDGWAFENCVENASANGVEGLVTPILSDVSAIAGRSYDFVLANINRNILLADMARYAAAMGSGAGSCGGAAADGDTHRADDRSRQTLSGVGAEEAVRENGAVLVMSGILDGDVPAIVAAAAAHGLTHLSTLTKEGWATVVCAKRQAAPDTSTQ